MGAEGEANGNGNGDEPAVAAGEEDMKEAADAAEADMAATAEEKAAQED
jgi:hypothetical protein